MPVQKRSRTQPITRVRTGCLTCRRRKKRCDECKPVCTGCMRNKLSCEWPASNVASPKATYRPESRRDGSPFSVEYNGDSSRRRSSPAISTTSTSPAQIADRGTDPQPHESQLFENTAEDYPAGTPTSGDVTGQGLELQSLSIPRGTSLLPGYDVESYQLLNHYLSSTADCMANGSNPINPFLVQIVPLAFSSDLLLQLVLTQSAAHRAFRCQNNADAVAHGQYTKALQRFRRGISDFIGEAESTPLTLTVGALLMCFTETAKGDTNGTIFDHLTAANSLLSRLMSKPDSTLPKELEDFVIEYYTYTASVSMISADAGASPQLLMNFEREQRAQQLVDRQYVGNLCGCWLELLLLIPSIFGWGRQWTVTDNQSAVPTADDFLIFGSLQAQILRWSPYPWVTLEVSLAGRIFQQAMLLYLYTAAGCLQPSGSGMYQVMVGAATSEAMEYLDQLSPKVRINSGLCWPIAVVGSCLSDPKQQDCLRRRLNEMVGTFGLGNMHRTLLLLEHMWQMSPGETGPWSISRVMQEHRIRFSFA